MSRHPVAVAVAALVVVLLGGCDMSSSHEPAPAASGQDRFRQDRFRQDRFRLDLRTPPAAPQALYLHPGQDSVSFARGSSAAMLDVDIELPGGIAFRNPAVSWETRVTGGSTGTGGYDVAVHRVEATADDAERVLLGQAGQVGFDAAAIRAFVGGVKAAGPTSVPENQVFTTRVGYLTLSADLRFDSTPGALIDYELLWDSPGATPHLGG